MVPIRFNGCKYTTTAEQPISVTCSENMIYERYSVCIWSCWSWGPRHSVSGAGEALGSDCDVLPAYLRLQLHRAWRLESLCSGWTGGGGGGGAGRGRPHLHYNLRLSSSITFLSFHKALWERTGRQPLLVHRQRQMGRQKKTPAEAGSTSLTSAPLHSLPPLHRLPGSLSQGPAHDMA